MTERVNSVTFNATVSNVDTDVLFDIIKTCSSHTQYPLHSIQIRAFFDGFGFRSLTPFVNLVTDSYNLKLAVHRVDAFLALKLFQYQSLQVNKFLIVLVFKYPKDSSHIAIQSYQSKFINPFKVALPHVVNYFERADFLPPHFDFTQWSDISSKVINGITYFILIVKSKTFFVHSHAVSHNENSHKVFFMIDGHLNELITITDKRIGDKSFTRSIGDTFSYTFDNCAINRVNKQLKFPILSTVKRVKTFNTHFITMDLECILSKPDSHGVQKFSPYAMGVCEYKSQGKYSVNTFWLPDFNSSSDMLEAAFNSISSSKYKGLPVYFHNLNGFDLPFIVNVLTKLGELKVIRRNDKIIELKFYPHCSPGCFISIRDSLLLLPGSLDNLSKTFSVDKPKTAFPHQFVNINNLSYVGNRPNASYWPIGATPCGPETNWILKDQLLNYLEADVISLAQVIAKFQAEIHDKHGINIFRSLTLPSLAFKIFRSNYYNPEINPIVNIQGKVDDAIRQSYFGGVVDAFIPYGESLYKYDINSSYPASMMLDMPIGNPTFIEGANLDLQDDDLFGFYYAEVSTDKNLPSDWNPVLPVKVDGRTITPVGSWKGWYFTEELRYAIKYGYNVKLIHGYNFRRGRPFDAYIDNWYGIKCTASKDSVLYFISKLFLNSLYGRFGMNTQCITTKIIDADQLDALMDKNVIDNISHLDGDKIMIDILDPSIDYDSDMSKNNFRQSKSNVAIASAITAYSRININGYKNIPGNPCYYMDTDCVVLHNPLPDDMVSSKTLGMMKLEHTIKRGVFLGPKSYCCEYMTNKGFEYDCKIKGLSTVKPTQGLPHGFNKPSFDQMVSLLNQNAALNLSHQIWYRDLKSGAILVKDQPYKLSMTFTKRTPVYKNGRVIKTIPYVHSGI